MTSPGTTPAPLLVVDDDRDLREVLAECLRFEGYEVVEAVDGVVALDHLRRGLRPALIFLDLVMPRMNGREFLARVREEPALASLPIVLVTGTPPSDLKGSVRAILKKPVGIDDLLACVRTLAGGMMNVLDGTSGA